MTTRNILILPGDGIGPEVMAEVERLIAWFNTRSSVRFETSHDLVGGTSFDKHCTPVTEEAMKKALAAGDGELGHQLVGNYRGCHAQIEADQVKQRAETPDRPRERRRRKVLLIAHAGKVSAHHSRALRPQVVA